MSDSLYKSYADSLADASIELLTAHLEHQRERFLNPNTLEGELGRISNNMAIVTNLMRIWHIRQELANAQAELGDLVRMLSHSH